VYRDGVGDGNLAIVYEHEVELMKKQLKGAYGYDVKFTFIIVSKRIMTRFFLNNDNPPCGTIIDDVVTQPER